MFRRVKGVIKVFPGYAGGNRHDPNYFRVSTGKTDHAEVVYVFYDSQCIKLEDLVQIFMDAHEPQLSELHCRLISDKRKEFEQQRLKKETQGEAEGDVQEDEPLNPVGLHLGDNTKAPGTEKSGTAPTQKAAAASVTAQLTKNPSEDFSANQTLLSAKLKAEVEIFFKKEQSKIKLSKEQREWQEKLNRDSKEITLRQMNIEKDKKLFGADCHNREISELKRQLIFSQDSQLRSIILYYSLKDAVRIKAKLIQIVKNKHLER